MGVWVVIDGRMVIRYPGLMKTTVELPEELLRAAQRTARREGTTVKSLLEEGLRLALARHLDHEVTGLRDASVGGNGLQPEFRGASWAEIRNAAYGDRL
jgi:hypothetical protein